MGDCVATACAVSSTRSSICCAQAVPGAISHPISHLGRYRLGGQARSCELALSGDSGHPGVLSPQIFLSRSRGQSSCWSEGRARREHPIEQLQERAHGSADAHQGPLPTGPQALGARGERRRVPQGHTGRPGEGPAQAARALPVVASRGRRCTALPDVAARGVRPADAARWRALSAPRSSCTAARTRAAVHAPPPASAQSSCW
jgi:hypothetical protein